MDKHSIETIELEMAVLFRRLTSITTFKKIGNLDRAAYLLLHHIASREGTAGIKAISDEFQLDISTVSLYRLPHWRVRGTSPGCRTLWTGGLIRCRLRRRAKQVWRRTGRSGRR